MVSLTPQISMMAMIAPAGNLVGDREIRPHLAVAQFDFDGLGFHLALNLSLPHPEELQRGISTIHTRKRIGRRMVRAAPRSSQ